MTDVVERAAQQLRDAADSSMPGPPVRNILGDDIELADAVQRLNNDHAVARGRRVSGRKIGLTSAIAQEFLGVSTPCAGMLFADMCVADGDDIDAGRLLQPRAEGEVALVLAHDLDGVDGADGNLTAVAEAVAHALPAIEIVDSRVADWDLTIVDMIADNAGSGLYVVGDTAVPLASIDLALVPMSLSVNGVEQSAGSGAACLGSPLHALAWLAAEMSARGTPLRAGECIMTGALGPMVAMEPGATLSGDFGPLGSVSTRWLAPT